MLTTGSRQLVEQSLRLFQIGGIEPFGKPAVDRSEDVTISFARGTGGSNPPSSCNESPKKQLSHSPDGWPAWLGEEAADVAQLKALLAPYPSEEMACWPVSARVGNVRNNDASLVEPIVADEAA